MLFVALITYAQGNAALQGHRPAHREYLRTFLGTGQLRAAGPFADDGGALWVLEADSLETAERIVREDPYVSAGVITGWTVRRLAYWSAQAAKAAQ